MKPRRHLPMTPDPDRRERGASLVEYVLIVGLVAMVALVGVGAAGSAVKSSFDTTAGSFGAAGDSGEPEPTYPTETAAYKDQITADFAIVDGKVVMVDSSGDGWTMKITKQKDNRINTRWKNPKTGEVVRINGWVTKKGDLRTVVK
ncbi:MAG: hypothetical protein KDB69_07615 [Acidimicrobiia bacterium]|nr:hypothetical protein [Acidimicrobiia bacterium]